MMDRWIHPRVSSDPSSGLSRAATRITARSGVARRMRSRRARRRRNAAGAGNAPDNGLRVGCGWRCWAGAGGGSQAGSVSRGSAIAKLVLPGRLVTRTAPPWAATTASTIARPRPVDEALVVRDRDVSARVNRSNRSGSRSGGMPGPLSVTDTTSRGGVGRVPRRTVCAAGADPPSGSASPTRTVTVAPSGVCLPALESTLASTWCSRCSSPLTSTGSSGSSRTQRCPGRATWASLVASMTSRVMSTGSDASGRPASSRASSSSSSTRTLIRVDSDSTRPSAWVTSSGESPGWRSASSA